MKKTYSTPLTDIDILAEIWSIMADSGPTGGDSTPPEVSDEQSLIEQVTTRRNLWDTPLSETEATTAEWK